MACVAGIFRRICPSRRRKSVPFHSRLPFGWRGRKRSAYSVSIPMRRSNMSDSFPAAGHADFLEKLGGSNRAVRQYGLGHFADLRQRRDGGVDWLNGCIHLRTRFKDGWGVHIAVLSVPGMVLHRSYFSPRENTRAQTPQTRSGDGRSRARVPLQYSPRPASTPSVPPSRSHYVQKRSRGWKNEVRFALFWWSVFLPRPPSNAARLFSTTWPPVARLSASSPAPNAIDTMLSNAVVPAADCTSTVIGPLPE